MKNNAHTDDFPTGTLQEVIDNSHAEYVANKAGPFLEILCRQDRTGGPNPGILLMAEDYQELWQEGQPSHWDIIEYDSPQIKITPYNIRKLPHSGLTTEQMRAVVRAMGYDPDLPYWMSV